jgi:radical SAM protein
VSGVAGAAPPHRAERDRRLAAVDFDRAPFVIAWELTRACAYSCAHCRADAQPRRHPDELDTSQAMRVIDDLAGFGTAPILVLTGGDPLMRRDVFQIAAHARRRGLPLALTPTATALTTPDRMVEARSVGIRRVAFSLDAPRPALHDRFRGFSGSFEHTLAGIAAARAAGLALQINTTACRLNAGVLKEMAALVGRLHAVQWSVFFLVPTGRGRGLEMLSAAEHERTIRWLDRSAAGFPFDLKLTAAPQHRRVALERSGSGAICGAGFHFADGLRRPAKGVNDGRGFMFISHRGEVMPSGFLPISAGCVPEESAVRLYREAPLFRELRDPSALRGKCGRCEYREVCGGSRARAFAVSGDHLAADPSCPYDPAPD